MIKSLTVESVLSSIRRSTHAYLQKIVCVDLSVDDTSQNQNLNQNVSETSPRYPGYPQQYGLRSTSEPTQNQNQNQNQNSELSLQPCGGNKTAYALLLLLEQEIYAVRKSEYLRENEILTRQNDPFSILNKRDVCLSDDMPRVPTIRLLVCNIPLPCSLSAISLYPNLKNQRKNSINLGYSSYGVGSGVGFDPRDRGQHDHVTYSEYRYEEQGMIVIRGLSAGILRAVRAIKSLVATGSSTY